MFCLCGTLISLPLLVSEKIVCKRCRRVAVRAPAVLYAETTVFVEDKIESVVREEGARIKMNCPKCSSKEMIYNTAQLRSADEGQTVFYRCPECSYKETVNS